MNDRQSATPLSRYFAKQYAAMSRFQKAGIAMCAGFSICTFATVMPLCFVLLQRGF